MKTKTIMTALLLGSCISAVSADTLLINSVHSRPEVQRPDRGITKSQVEQRFGQPNAQTSAVGEPPISRWMYNDFTVFFEYDRVIHTVVSHQQ